MASDALRSQVAAKWQEAFSRLNRNEPGITGLITFSQAWNYALHVLRPRPLDELRKDVDMNKVRSAFTIINASRRLPFLLETFLEELRQQYWLVQKDLEEHMERFLETEDADIVRGLILRLVAWFKHWAPLQELGTTIYAAYSLSFQTHLFSSVPPTFARAIKALVASTLSGITSESIPPPPSADTNVDLTKDPNALIWQAFETLGLIDRYESIIATVGYEFIEQYVLSTCTGEWSRPMLTEVRDWMSEKVVPWMLLIYARGATNAEEARGMLQGVGSRFDFHINKTLCDLRTREIFDIIIDFPDSTGALQDLRDCLQRVDQRPALIKALRQANRKRLLHPGADTKLILSQYVAIIKCLRIIDPPGVLLFKVADPIRRYLRDRPDTIRCIVANLVGDDTDSPDSLLDDTIDPSTSTGGGGPGVGAGGTSNQSSSNNQLLVNPANQVDDYSDPNWDPEPIDAGPEFRTNKPSDVLSTLVSIYDSQDLFVKELQVLLAQRLLAIPISSSSSSSATPSTVERIDKERRNVEILKLRFGEAALGVCEVMLRDMSDSRRVDGLVQAVGESILHPTIISHHFWPPLASSSGTSSGGPPSGSTSAAATATGTIQMPGPLSTLQQTYAETFTKLKPDKKLKFLPHLGTLTLTLTFPPSSADPEGREMEVTVPPLEAAFIQLFSEKGMWTLDELIEGVGGSGCVDRGPALKALLTWIDHGVVEEVGEGEFRLIEGEKGRGGKGEGGPEGGGLARQAVAAQEAAVQPVSTAQQQQAEQMRVYWKFIEGMLTNLGGLPLDRIQSMLRFAPGYDQTVEQLAAFLEAARREGVVVFRENLWRLNK